MTTTRFAARRAARKLARKAAQRTAAVSVTYTPQAVANPIAFVAGQEVSALYSNGVWYPARIARKAKDGSLTVRYVEDGIKQRIVDPASELRAL